MMKPVFKFVLKIILPILFVVICTELTVAQGTPGLPGFPANPDPAPIDGGLGLLATAGGAYDMKKLRDKKHQGEIDD